MVIGVFNISAYVGCCAFNICAYVDPYNCAFAVAVAMFAVFNVFAAFNAEAAVVISAGGFSIVSSISVCIVCSNEVAAELIKGFFEVLLFSGHSDAIWPDFLQMKHFP